MVHTSVIKKTVPRCVKLTTEISHHIVIYRKMDKTRVIVQSKINQAQQDSYHISPHKSNPGLDMYTVTWSRKVTRSWGGKCLKIGGSKRG